MSGASEEPRNLVERAAAAAMDAAGKVLEAEGAKVDRVYIALAAGDVPVGELDAVAAFQGEAIDDDAGELERARELVAFLVSEAASAGKAIGVDIRVLPMGRMGQG